MKNRKQLDEILAGGHLPGQAYDEIFERVLATTAPRAAPRAERRPGWLLIPGIAATALGTWLVFFTGTKGRFLEKGGVSPAPSSAAGIDLACKSSAGPRCRVDDTLMFLIRPDTGTGYLGAYAQRTDDPDGERIWYFPSAAHQSPLVGGAATTTVLDRAVQVGPEHRPGTYRVTLWLDSNPIERGRGPSPDRATTRTIEIVP